MAGRAESPEPTVHYIPNEVCIVVEDERRDRSAEEAYKLLLPKLNERLVKLRPTERPPRDPFALDLAPSQDLLASLSSGAALRPLDEAEGRPDKSRLRPAVTLARDGRTTHLLFYRFGPSRTTVDDPSLALNLRLVRELTVLANANLAALEKDIEGLRVVAVSPNWLTVPTHSSESPATSPEAIANVAGRGRYTVDFKPPPFDEALRRPRADGQPASVAVAVLDTCPSPQRVADALADFPDNELLEDVVKHPDEVVIEGDLSIPADDFAHLGGLLPNWKERLPELRRAEIVSDQADHGLFVAGLIRDIAPQADIYLYRVLDDDGLGETSALVNVLAALPDRLLRGQRAYKRLIVNLSLVADLPPGAAFLAEWLPRTARDPGALARNWRDICTLHERLHRNLASVIDWLAEQEILVVAASGNQGLGRNARPEPAYPAAYDTVLSVAAINSANRPAFYSQRGDRLVFGNGVAVFGGEGEVVTAGELPVIPPSILGDESGRDAVAGLFSARTLPLRPPGADDNATGWVWWSGTSFATPIVSGVAANLWLTDTAPRPPDVMAAVRAHATIDEVQLEQAGGPFEVDAIAAAQRYDQR